MSSTEYFKETLDENNLSAHRSALYKCPQYLTEYFKETLDENNLCAHQSTLYKCPQCLVQSILKKH